MSGGDVIGKQGQYLGPEMKSVHDLNIIANHPARIAAIEARGFLFSSSLSYNLSKPLILMRKKDKLPSEKYSQEFVLEYGKSTLEMHKDSGKC